MQRLKEETANAAAARKSWLGFADTMTAMAAARMDKAFSRQIQYRGSFLALGDLIIERVKDGWKLGHSKTFGTVLESPDGTILTDKELTKTGLKFADYLIRNRVL